MNNQNNEEQTLGQTPPPPKWLGWFLLINVTALAGLLIWELGSAAYKSDDKIIVELQKKTMQVESAVSKNRPPSKLGATLSEEIEYVIDATEAGNWNHFDFSNSTIFHRRSISKEAHGWDIAIRRAKIVTNSGKTSPKGRVSVVSISATSLKQVKSAPKNGYLQDIKPEGSAETANMALDKWYTYDFWTHKLKPKNEVYVLKTWNDRLVKFKIVSYYCESAPACFTIRYQYQGEIGADFK